MGKVADATGSPTTELSGVGSAPSGSSTVKLNTIDLNTQDSGSEALYAVCYSDTTSANTEPFYDSGIRVSLPEVVNMQQDSGYTSTNTKMKVCIKLGTSPQATCDVNLDGNKNQACTRNSLCTNDAGCGTGG